MLNDEDIIVRLEAIEDLVDLLSTFLSQEQIDSEVLPAIVKHFILDNDDEESLIKMSGLFGKILFNLPLEK